MPIDQAEAEMKVYLRDLAFESAKEVEVTSNKKAVIIQVRLLVVILHAGHPGSDGALQLTRPHHLGAIPTSAEIPQATFDQRVSPNTPGSGAREEVQWPYRGHYCQAPYPAQAAQERAHWQADAAA